MLASVQSSALFGVQSVPIQVEVDVSQGLPSFDIVGLPGAAVREARDRVRSALRHSGFPFPLARITVNLAPAHLPKGGTFFDLPIAMGILVATGVVPAVDEGKEWVVVGELSLNGDVRPVRGALCMALWAKSAGKTLVIPEGNRREVEGLPGVRVVAAASLSALVSAWKSGLPFEVTRGRATPPESPSSLESWDAIRGQKAAKRALEIAVAGGHHAILVGPPGSGKTALAKCVPQLAPALSEEESVEVSSVYSAAGLLDRERPFVDLRPFRSPHPSVTTVGLLGGGRLPQPGEVSLAHKGFLFLDELPEYGRSVVEGLRGPLEEGAVVLSRLAGKCRFPAEFTLIATANPCPCGYFGDPARPCICLEVQLHRYRRRLSGPLMDRIDLFVTVFRPSSEAVLSGVEASQAPLPLEEDVRRRILRAAEAQRRRYGTGTKRNRDLTPAELRRHVALDERGRGFLARAAERWQLSPRAIHRVLRVARTLADLEGSEDVTLRNVTEALSFRREACFPST